MIPSAARPTILGTLSNFDPSMKRMPSSSHEPTNGFQFHGSPIKLLNVARDTRSADSKRCPGYWNLLDSEVTEW